MAPETFPDPLQYLAGAEPGTVVYSFANDGGPLQIEYLIREASPVISAIAGNPELQIRAAAMEEGGVPVVVVAMGFSGGKQVYPSFWNYCHQVGGPEDGNVFDHMADGSGEILVQFVGDSGKVESMFPLKHPLGAFFHSARKRFAAMPHWCEDDFCAAVWNLSETYPEPGDLWAALGGIS